MHLSRGPAALAAVTAAVATLGAAFPLVATAGTTSAAKIPAANGCFHVSRLQPGTRLDASQRTLEGLGLGNGADCNPTVTGYRLVLQADGNLVEYADGAGGTSAVWSTRTRTATHLEFQSDHNVVLYDAAGRALWSSGTAGSGAAYFAVYGNGQVVTQDAAGRVLSTTGPATTALPGTLVQIARSPQRRYFLTVQADGNLVEYRYTNSTPQPVWSTGTAGRGAVRLAAQADGNLVLYQLSTGRAVWNSRSVGPAAYYQLDVQDDANVVLYRTDGARRLQAVWASSTHV